jgi:thioredoxin 1
MATIELTKESFADVVGGAKLVLVNFWGPQCRLCGMFEPVFEEASQRHPDAVFGKVDAQAHGQLAAVFRVMSLPTLVIIKEGFVIYARSGALSLEDLEDLVGQARALDMDGVRRRRAARRATASLNIRPGIGETLSTPTASPPARPARRVHSCRPAGSG